MTHNDLYENAMLILAQREHSIQEIRDKLQRKGGDLELVEPVIDQLIELNYLNDQRFAQTYIRSKSSRLYGLFRIKQELRMKGVCDEDVAIAVEEEPVEWFENAKFLRLKKFGASIPTDFKDKSKQVRYLQSHGFSYDEIYYSMEPDE